MIMSDVGAEAPPAPLMIEITSPARPLLFNSENCQRNIHHSQSIYIYLHLIELVVGELLAQPLGRCVAPSRHQRAADDALDGVGEMNDRCALPAPPAGDGLEDLRMLGDECCLLLRRELGHAAGFVGHSKGGEDLLVNAKVRM